MIKEACAINGSIIVPTVLAAGCPKCGGRLRQHGSDRRGIQRYKCAVCSATTQDEYKTVYELRREVRQPELVRLVSEGHSVRAASAMLGMDKNTAFRYLKGIPIKQTYKCGCGLPSGHREWCWWRYARSEKRQSLMARLHELQKGRGGLRRARVAPITEYYPYLPVGGDSEYRLVELVNSSVPKTIPEQIRADVCQEVLLAVLSGRLHEDEIGQSIKEFVGAVYRQSSSRYTHLSIDQPMYGDVDGRTLGELISAEY